MTEKKTDTQSGQLQWVAKPTIDADASEIHLFLDPILGLMDIDFHQVSGSAWDKMKADSPDSSATLAVAPEVNMKQLMEALDSIQKQGGYGYIAIVVHQP